MIEKGYCQCGCGEKTPLAKKTSKLRGHIKGEPVKFIFNHHLNLRRKNFDDLIVKRENGCWEYIGSHNVHGYGMYSHNSETWMAHRWAYVQAKGEIPAGKIVRHTCDNPPCCNPDHLILGTMRDNMNDMLDRDRHALAKPKELKDKIYADFQSGKQLKELAQIYPMSYGAIQKYVKRRKEADEQFDTCHG